MPMASGSADARTPPRRPAEATITVAIEKAHAVIPSAWVGRPAGAPAGNDATVAGEPTSCSAAGRPILAWAPGEDGPNLRRTTPKSPVRVASGRTHLHPADWAPGGHRRPEELPRPSRVSLERVSSSDPKAAEPHRRHGGWRHPPPSGSPSGPVGPSGRTPTRISRSNRVGPSGRSGI